MRADAGQTVPERAQYFVARALFLRLLGFCFLVAFVSLWVQLDGLIGSRGLMPAAEHLERLRAAFEPHEIRRAPTLFWLRSDDLALHFACGAGTLLALAVLAGWFQKLALALLWLLHLSFLHVAVPYLSFQWDVLLQECALLGIFLAPWSPFPSGARRTAVPSGVRWCLWLLLFRLMLASGLVKLAAESGMTGARPWHDLAALDYHYWTQPLPPWTAYYAHLLPKLADQACVAAMFAIELGMPFLIFAPRRLRLVAAGSFLLLMAAIQITGSYTYFNLLSAALAFLLIDDGAWRRVLPGRVARRCVPAEENGESGNRPAAERVPGSGGGRGAMRAEAVRPPLWRRALVAPVLAGTVALGFARFADRLGADRLVPDWLRTAGDAIDGLRSVNGYGLFARMTTTRPEIVIEATADGTEWVEVPFRWKPGAVDRRPRMAAPHQPRLDWQMWFDALAAEAAVQRSGAAGAQRAWLSATTPWLRSLLQRLLEAEPDVLALLDHELLRERGITGAPARVRMSLYRYRFSTPAEKDATGAWWARERFGPPPLVFELRAGLLRLDQ